MKFPRFLKNANFWVYSFTAIFVLVVRGFNLFHYPYYENDEGTYMSQAWSIIREGKLAPYTYWYDHSPFGWILISGWVILTGGFFTFGPSVNSGRVFVLILFIIMVLLFLFISKKLTSKYTAGVIAALFLTLSPLSIYFQRRVLLDNIMIFEVILALAILYKSNLKLRHVFLSSLVFGLAVLTKENAIFFLPAFIYTIYKLPTKLSKSFSYSTFMITPFLIISIYVLYAILKNEFFPTNIFGERGSHVSLVDTLAFHASRGVKLPFWDTRSDIYYALFEWLKRDPMIIILGMISTLYLLFNQKYRIISIFSISLIIFYVRGGLILDFYVTPLVTLLSMGIGLMVFTLIEKIKSNYITYLFIFPLTINFSLFTLLYTNALAFHKDETVSQIETIKWIKNNMNENDTIAIDNSIWVDLHEPGYINDKIFENADWSWKVYEDPEIRDDKLNNDWKNISYIALSHEILKTMKHYDKSFLYKALINSDKIAEWREGTTSHIDIDNLISTNGDWMAIYKVRDPNDIYLEESWKIYKEKFIHSYGQVVDPQSGYTTSEAQSYALLRSVWMNDKDTFDGVWNWTKDHLQFRGDNLFSWQWGQEGDKETVLDPNSATDADSDIALALIFASKQFSNPNYSEEAKLILTDIWEKETVVIKGRHLLLPSPQTEGQTQYLVNPSYLFPAAYRIFAEVDTEHDWNKLADDSYYFLDQFSNYKGSVKLLPNWVIINTKGEISSATEIIGSNADHFGFDSFRTYWKAALDYKWFNSPESKTYLEGPLNFFEKEYKQHKNFMAVYDLNGNVSLNFNNMSTLSGPFALFTISNPELSHDVYENIYKHYFEKGEHQNSDNYYDQNWTWFSIALYSNRLQNLWKD